MKKVQCHRRHRQYERRRMNGNLFLLSHLKHLSMMSNNGTTNSDTEYIRAKMEANEMRQIENRIQSVEQILRDDIGKKLDSIKSLMKWCLIISFIIGLIEGMIGK